MLLRSLSFLNQDVVVCAAEHDLLYLYVWHREKKIGSRVASVAVTGRMSVVLIYY
jgi:hypothetical protein